MIKAQIFPAESGEWTWHIKSANGRITCYAGETFASKTNARRALNKFVQSIINMTSTSGITIHQCMNNIQLQMPVEVLDYSGRVVKEY